MLDQERGKQTHNDEVDRNRHASLAELSDISNVSEGFVTENLLSIFKTFDL